MDNIGKLCKHFGECGGCAFQDIPYAEQLKRKEDSVRNKLASYEISTEVKPINAYPEWFYRGKMEFAFAEQEGVGVICGLHSKIHKRAVFDLKECYIFSEDIPAVLDAVRYFVRSKGYTVYNNYRHYGFLRHLIIRETKFTGELMIGIVTTSERVFDSEEFVQALRSLPLKTNLKSIYWIVNDARSDAVVFQRSTLLWGVSFIQEKLGAFLFHIGIDTFFQVNSIGICDLYNKINAYARLTGRESVLDLCCGTGTIGIFIACGARFVWGVDIHKEIIDAAWENAKINKITNISFLVSDIRRFLNTQGAFYKSIDLIVVNPPRSGISQKVIRGILRLGPEKIIYSSCNLDSLCSNLKDLHAAGYSIDFIEPFDFFPHTPHIECLAVLKKI